MKAFDTEVWFPYLFANREAGRQKLSEIFRDAEFSWDHAEYTNAQWASLDFRSRLPSIRARSLVIAGRHDMLPPSRAQEIADGIDGRRVRDLRGERAFRSGRGEGEVRSDGDRFSASECRGGLAVIRSFCLIALVAFSSCASPDVSVVRLVDAFEESMVEGRTTPPAPPPRTEWRFDESGSAFTAVEGVEGLVAAGRASPRASDHEPARRFTSSGRPTSTAATSCTSIEVRIRVSEGANLKAEVSGAEKIDPEKPLADLPPFDWAMTTPLVAGEEMRTYTLKYPRPVRASQIRRLYLQPTDAEGATFEIESVRMIFRQEHLAGIPSGIGFQGMSEIYRESIVARTPEVLSIPLTLPSRPLLEVSLGTVDDAPVRFRVAVGNRTLVEQTVSTPYRWEERFVDLGDFAGQGVTLTLSLHSEREGAIGIWGGPVVRQRDPARAEGSPKGVILVWADTLRRDHLDAYGYGRETAPTLKRFASEGVLFENNFSQATWTKVSTPSVLTSLYPSTHGVKNFSDYLPSSATTLAEVYRGAGYATVSFASNLFTAQFTNLHQGFEELHEDGSLPEVGSSKTSREYVDRFTRWLRAPPRRAVLRLRPSLRPARSLRATAALRPALGRPGEKRGAQGEPGESPWFHRGPSGQDLRYALARRAIEGRPRSRGLRGARPGLV